MSYGLLSVWAFVRIPSYTVSDVAVSVIVRVDNEDGVCTEARCDCHSLLCVVCRTRRLGQDHYRQNSGVNRILRRSGIDISFLCHFVTRVLPQPCTVSPDAHPSYLSLMLIFASQPE